VESGQLLSDAVELMALGMGTVFVFLTILVYVTATMSALVKKYAPVQPAGHQVPAGTPAQPEDQTLLAVIAAAIHAHRNR
jgi:oxaloacetate decarboxylase gamma subunit